MPFIRKVPDANFAVFHGVYDRPTTWQHRQLRDLVHCSDDPTLVYCVYRSQIIRYDIVRNQSTVVKTLTFEPTSLACTHGFLAAGGDRSQLYVGRLLDGQQIYDNCIGGTVNNALHINTNSNGDLRLFVCNNDCNIKIYELQSSFLRQLTHVRCPVPINYACLSPDSSLMVAVGDGKDTYMYQVREDRYERVQVYRETDEACMSCAWNATGTCFAVASEEGRVVVWDHKSGKVVTKFNMGEPCRGVKFSCAPVDLLAFSEHKDMVHLVDARCYNTKQSFRAAPTDADQTISGLAFSPCGSRLFVGAEDGLAEFKINLQSRRSFPFCDTV